MSLSVLEPSRPVTVAPSRPTGPRPSPAALHARLAELVPVFRSRATAAEKAGRVPAESLAALREAGFYRIVQPAMFGGHEYDFSVLADLVMEAAKGCPSTGWVLRALRGAPVAGRELSGAGPARRMGRRPGRGAMQVVCPARQGGDGR